MRGVPRLSSGVRAGVTVGCQSHEVRLSLSSSVIPIRNVDILPRSPMLCPLLFLAWSRVVACLVVVHVSRGCAEQRISCSLRPCAGYASCGPVNVLYVIMSLQSSVFSVRAKNVTRLVWASRMLLGMRIIATVHIPLFPSLDERCGHVSSSWLSSLCSSIYTVTSVLTQRELDLFCSTYNIPAELRPELPDQNSTIRNNPEGKIGMYTRFIEFASYQIPLSKFLLCILEYYQINLSQLSVIGEAKVSHFEIMCCVFGRIPTVGTFRRFYVNSYSNGLLSFSKHGDASVCPMSLPWFDGTSVVKDPLPMDEAVDLPCAELLNENRTLIRKYPKTFLCLVGLSRSFFEIDVRPTLLHGDNEGNSHLMSREEYTLDIWESLRDVVLPNPEALKKKKMEAEAESKMKKRKTDTKKMEGERGGKCESEKKKKNRCDGESSKNNNKPRNKNKLYDDLTPDDPKVQPEIEDDKYKAFAETMKWMREIYDGVRVKRDNVDFDLTKSHFCPSSVEDLTAKGVGFRVVDSHTGNHREDDFMPLETI
ncbi:hypothetical protein Tco_0493545 [Tanacetum coccineum]